MPLSNDDINNFNPRSLEGSDFCRPPPEARSEYFNPRSREGSDKQITFTAGDRDRFQSTLP